MQATVELPEPVLRQLEVLAEQEGATPADLILRLVEAHVDRCGLPAQGNFEARLPLIAASETGQIRPVTGSDIDEIFTRDHLTP